MVYNHGYMAGTATDTAHREAWGLFWRIFVADKPRRWAALGDLGLTMMQGMALSQLDPGKPERMSALAERMQCDNSNITGIADRLEALGLIERRADPNDRRVKTLVLTPKGVELKAQVALRAGEPPPGFSSLTEAEAETLRDLLAKAAAAQPGT